MGFRLRAKSFFKFIFRAIGLFLHGIFRGLGLAIIFLVLLGITAFFTLKHMFNEEGVKAVLVAQLQEIFHRPVQIDGFVLTPNGMKLRGVRVLDHSGVPGGYLMVSDFALITVKFAPLLKRRVELSDVKLVAPQIQFYRDENGVWNTADFFVSAHGTETVKNPAGPFSLPFSLAADRTVIEGGVLNVEDRLRGRKFKFEKFNLTVKEFDMHKPFVYLVSFDNVNAFEGKEIGTSWSFGGDIFLASLDWAKATLSAEKLKVSIDGSLVRGSVKVKGFPRFETELDLKAPALGPAQWAKYMSPAPDFFLPASQWRLKMTSVEPKKIRIDRLRLDAAPLAGTVSGLIDWSGASPRFNAAAAVENFPLASAASFRPRLARYQMKGMANAQGSLSGWFGRVGVHQARIGAQNINATLPHAKISGGDLNVAASDDFSKTVVGISRGAVSAFSNSFTDIFLSLNLKNKDLKVENLSLKWGGSDLKLKARVKDVGDPKEVVVSGTLDTLRWEDGQRLVSSIAAQISTQTAVRPEPEESKKPWLRTFKYAIPKKFPDTVGHIVIKKITQQHISCNNLDLFWDIRGVSPSLKYVSGELKVGFGPGHVSDISSLQKSHNILKIVFLPFVFMHKMNNLSVLSASTAYPKVFDFSRIEGAYGLRSGVATTRYFYVDSPQFAAYADGEADFGKEVVGMNILTRLAHYRGQLPEWWVDELGRPAIAFKVKGDLADPELEPRLRKMKNNEIENMKAEAIGRATTTSSIEEKIKEL